MKRKSKLRSLLLLAFSALFLVSSYMSYGIISQAQREQENFERLEETIKGPSASSDPVQPQEPSETDAASSPYAALKEQNPDFFGWISIAQDEASRKAELTQKRKALSGAQKRMEDLDKIIQRLYEDSVLGKLSDLRFQKLSAQYETEQAEIQQLASSQEQEIENEARQIADVGRFLQLADRYSDLQELDASTVNELIDKIVIHSPEKIGGKKHVTIEVYFTYVGKIRIPLHKPNPIADTEKPA